MAINSISESREAGIAPIAAPTRASNPQQRELSLLELLIILAERKSLIIATVLGFAIVSVIVSLLLPPRYTATVTLMPPEQNSSMASMLASQVGSLGGVAGLAGSSLGIKTPNDMYIAMLKSRTVEDGMVHRFGLMQQYHSRYPSDARKALESRTKIDGNGKDNMIHIAVEDPDPNRAAQLANGFVDQFRDLSEHVAITEAARRRLFFEQQLEQTKNKLADAEESLKQTEQKTGIIQINGQAAALIQSAVSLRAQITAKEVEIQSMRTFATDENADLVKAQQELDGLRAQLAKLGGSEDSGDPSVLLPKGLVSEAALEFVRKERDVKYYETIFDLLARQFEAAKLDEAKQGGVVQVIDSAIPPDHRSSPKRAIIVIVSTIVGCFIGAFLAFVQAGLQQARKDPEVSSRLSTLRRALSFNRSQNSRVLAR
jgi:tyrosine-protein kinase Etk/Wzc